MSGITLTDEFAVCAGVFGWTLDDMEWLTLNAAKSAFYEFGTRLAMINTVIKPGYRGAARIKRAVSASKTRAHAFEQRVRRANAAQRANLRGPA